MIEIRLFCPYCEKEHDVKVIEQEETITVRGEDFSAMTKYYLCPETEEEFETSDSHYDPLADAYEQYRRKYNMLSPEEIKAFRRKYKLTQKALSYLLSWEVETLRNYENGSLIEPDEDYQLKQVMNSNTLLND